MTQTSKDFSGQTLKGRPFKQGEDLQGANFSRATLRGVDFKGLDLTGANFSYADIRGANFSDAILKGANFSNSKARLQKSRLILSPLIHILLAVLMVILEAVGIFIRGFLGLILTVPAFWFLIYFSLLSGVLTVRVIFNFSSNASSFLRSITIVIILILLCYLDYNIAHTLLNSAVYLEYQGWGHSAKDSILSPEEPTDALLSRYTTKLAEIAVTFVGSFIIGSYCSWSSFDTNSWLMESDFFTLLRRIISASNAIAGTNFKSAKLEGADFTNATLNSTNFAEAGLAYINWTNVKWINRNYIVDNCLENSHVQQLVTSRNGQGKDFKHLNLRSLNLKGINLQDADLSGANLNNANLKGADLSRAILKQTQLDGADLTGVTLTGAYIEDWGVTAETKLDGIKCEYVYMRLPTKEDPEPIRKPDNRSEIFKDGDFADFIRPLTDTLDLYHNQGVDPRAIAIAFKDLAESHPNAELEIVAIEKKGRDKFLLRAKTATTADKSELSAEYFSTYNQIKSLSEGQVRALLVEKDSRIQSLEAMVVTALQRPSFYSHVERADMVSNNPGGISQNVSGGNVYGGMQAAQGNNNEQVQEIHSIASSEQGLTQAQVIELFAQLESVLRQPELPTEVQAKAAKYLEAAKEEVTAKEPDKQLAAGNLKRMAETIETTSKTMESGKKIWETTKPILEAVLPWLGVAKGFFGF